MLPLRPFTERDIPMTGTERDHEHKAASYSGADRSAYCDEPSGCANCPPCVAFPPNRSEIWTNVTRNSAPAVERRGGADSQRDVRSARAVRPARVGVKDQLEGRSAVARARHPSWILDVPVN